MPFTDTWNGTFEALPGDTDAISEGAERIRDTKVATRERLNVDHYFDPAGTDADHGLHRRVMFHSQIADPTVAANRGALYIKDVSAKAELHWKDEDNNVRQLTTGGKINVPWVLHDHQSVSAVSTIDFDSLTAGRIWRLTFNLGIDPTSGSAPFLRFQDDSGANYWWTHVLKGNDGTAAVSGTAHSEEYQTVGGGTIPISSKDNDCTRMSGTIMLYPGLSYPTGSDNTVMRVHGQVCCHGAAPLMYLLDLAGKYDGSASVTKISIRITGGGMSGTVSLEYYNSVAE